MSFSFGMVRTNKTSDEVIFDYEKLGWTFFYYFQTYQILFNRLLWTIISRLINNEIMIMIVSCSPN